MESAKTLGTVTGSLKNFAGLNDALGKLGMKPEQQAQFTPTLSLTISANQAAATCSRCSRPRSSRRSKRR